MDTLKLHEIWNEMTATAAIVAAVVEALNCRNEPICKIAYLKSCFHFCGKPYEPHTVCNVMKLNHSELAKNPETTPCFSVLKLQESTPAATVFDSGK